MKKLLLALIITISNANASWYAIECSSASGDFTFVETKLGQTLKVLKIVNDMTEVEVLENNWEDYDIVVEKTNEVDLGTIQEGECVDGMIQYYGEENSAVNITFSFSDSRNFPEGTLRMSDDKKSISVPMVCAHTYGGASSCAE